MIRTINNSKTTHIHNYKGFTLAETLITLVIIGVVAALTVPNLIVHYQKEHVATKLGKTYSLLVQIMNRAIAENGPMNTWEIENSKTKEFAEKYFLPYLSLGKNCEYNTTADCAFRYGNLNAPNNKQELPNAYYRFYLADGVLIAMFARSAMLGVYQGNELLGNFLGECVYVNVDINGTKGPNVLGKDVFQFIYYIRYDMGGNGADRSGKFIPMNYNGLFYDVNRYLRAGCNKNSSGNFCTAAIMRAGWKIPDGYPW